VIEPASSTTLCDQLRAFVARVQGETRVPGMAVALRLGKRELSINVGTRVVGHTLPLTRDARFHLGCATKLLLAVVTLELVRSGRLDLNAPIGEYLPELRGTLHGRTVRTSHLLSHTSGYRGTSVLDAETRGLTWRGFVDWLRRTPQFFEPGTVFSYEHTESVILGRVIQRLTRQSSLARIRDTIFEPLGIVPGVLDDGRDGPRYAGSHDLDRATGRFEHLTEIPALPDFWHAAFSNYVLTLEDIVTVVDAVMRGSAATGRDGDAGPVSDATAALLLRRVIALPPSVGGPLRELLPVGFGLGAAQFSGEFYGSSGITYGQCLGVRFEPRARIAVAVGINAMAPYLRDLVLATICRELAGPFSERPHQPLAIDLHDLVGVYLGPGKAMLVASLDDGRLKCEIGSETSDRTLTAELVLDGDNALVLHSPAPQLSLGVISTSSTGEPGLMVGLSAYKRVSRVPVRRRD
jgi:CubicO group peptidase (beta-lactamase class C family)